MNDVTQEAKDNTTKILAIFGFIAIIIFGVWLAVKVVGLIPGAFGSLASIADGVYNTNPQSGLTVAVDKSIVNTDEAFTVSWTETTRNGSYAFFYECVPGVSLAVRADGEVTNLACDEKLELEKQTSIEVIADSTENRFSDVPYMVSFTNAGAVDTFFEKTGSFTVVNAEIPLSTEIAAATDETEEEVATEPEVTEEPEVAGESTSTEEAVETNEETAVDPEPEVETPTTPVAPIVIEEPIFQIPTSDPNGFVDLSVTYLGVGHMENNNSFDPQATIDNDEKGSFRFAVRNLGTKTSDEWTFDATLPNGSVFRSQAQAELRPNEEALITLGFEAVGELGSQAIGAEIETDEDISTANNSFTWSVRIVE